MSVPDYLVVGTITKDVLPSGYTVGGTVTYGAITAHRLGRRAAIVTSASSDLTLPPEFVSIPVEWVSALQTTTFRNLYHNGTRTQYIESLSEPIPASAIPGAWRQAPMVHLGPLVQELDESLVHEFNDALIVATPQGWLRRWDEAGKVSLKRWEKAEELLPYVAAVVLSTEDVSGDAALLDRFIALAPVVVVTQGRMGAAVYSAGVKEEFPTRPAREVDPTGAGDVFAAAFLIRLYETAATRQSPDLGEAVRYANVVASFSVEGPGFSAIPSRDQVEDYLAAAR
jgi:1D-myo-inositol 3-kinase